MAIADLLRLLGINPVYRNRVVHMDVSGPKEARYGELRTPLSPSLAAYLKHKNIRLYSHQCDAIDRIRAGKNVIITTPTASGKTLAFNLPVFEKLETDPAARALYLYPTKALSNDQLATLEQMALFTGISAKPAIYDGDTPQSKRAAIRDNARIIVSNPHELHQVLSWHTKWRPFFSGLQFIVIDEAHRYRGVFGSHIAFLLRRLLRLCLFYGSRPQFVLSTATIANPVEFAGNLTGQPFDLIHEDGSPHGRKTFVLYNPFYDGIGERSAHQETKDLLLSCVKENLQTLCFTGSRKMAELVTLWAREDARHTSSRLADSISAYRAGYLPEERRATRTAAEKRADERNRLHQCTRARDRYRFTGCGHYLRLSRHHDVDTTAGGSCREKRDRVPCNACCHGKSSRPVLHEPPGPVFFPVA